MQHVYVCTRSSGDIGTVILSARHPRAEARGVGRRLLRKLLPSTVGVMRERGRGRRQDDVTVASSYLG